MVQFKFELGCEVKDAVTGFRGVVVFRTERLTGCNQYGVSPTKMKDGKKPEWEFFDENRLLKVGKGVVLPGRSKKDDGFDGSHPPVR